MKKPHSSRGRLVAICTAVALLAAAFGIHLRAWTFRLEAERFLSDVRALRMHETSRSEALRLRAHYPPGLWPMPSQASCSESYCEFSISVSEWMNPTLFRLLNSRIGGLLQAPLSAFGLRPTVLNAVIKVNGGRVESVSTQFVIAFFNGMYLGADVHANQNLSYWLNAVSESAQHMAIDEEPGDREGMMRHWLALEAHPTFLIRRWDGSGAAGRSVEFTPQLSRDDFLRMTEFNLKCLTAFRRCGYSEMAPQFEQQAKVDEARPTDKPPDNLCTQQAMENLARDATIVAEMRVKDVVAHNLKGPNIAFVDYELVRTSEATKGTLDFAKRDANTCLNVPSTARPHSEGSDDRSENGGPLPRSVSARCRGHRFLR